MSGLYYVDSSDGQVKGPLPVAMLNSWAASGAVDAEALMVWAEGMPEWIPLAKLQTGQDQASGAQPEATGAAERPRGAVISAAAATRAPADAALAEFEAELEALGEGEGAGPVSEAGDRVPSPDSEDREFEDDDGTWYVWDAARRGYIPKEDPAEGGGAAGGAGGAGGALPYSEADMAFPGEAAAPEIDLPAFLSDPTATGGKKRKAGAAGGGGKKAKPDKPPREPRKPVVTSVYVSGLPEDATVDEVKEVFSKCGIIKDGEDRRPKIRLYTDKETGRQKGDGLVTFLKEPSVLLAVQLLDGAPLRPGDALPMSVAKAEFDNKQGGGGEGGAGAGAGAGPSRPPQQGGQRKKGRGPGKPADKLLSWGGFDDMAPPEEVTVVLRGVFDQNELADGGPEAKQELEKDLKDECSKLGTVDRLKVYSSNAEGLVTVRFLRADVAAQCVAKLNGRFYAGRMIRASLWDGREQFAASGPGGRRETAEEEEARIEKFSRELEAQKAAH